MTRPSYAIYMRNDPRWRGLVDDGPYGFGYGCAQADVDAGLPEMSDAEMAALWHPDYSEGYRDGYADFGGAAYAWREVTA